MIHRDGFYKGQEVEFQDYRRCWVRGTVAHVEYADFKIDGPSGVRMIETKPETVFVVFETEGKARTMQLNPKLVRGVKA